MDFRQLRYFVAIYEHRSLTGAARETRVAVSALSHHLARLETELGTTLFERRPRGLVATAAGERLLVHARTLLRGLQTAERDLRDSREVVVGDVAIGLAYSAVKAIGVPLVQRVTEAYPRLRLSLSESLSGSTLLHLLASEVDLAVVFNPPEDSRLLTRPILDETLHCVGRPEVIGAAGGPLTFEEVLQLPIIALRHGLSARAIMNDTTLLKRMEAAARFQMNSVQAITGLLLAGQGCAIGTRHIFSEPIARGDLHVRPVIEPALRRTLYLCKLAGRPASFAVETVERLVIDLLIETVRDGGWDAEPALS